MKKRILLLSCVCICFVQCPAENAVAGLLGKALHGGAHAAVVGSQVVRVYRRTVEGAGALTVPMLEQCIINDKKLATADKKLGADTKKIDCDEE